MWELSHKEGLVQKYWCFWIVVLEKTLENPLDCKEIKPVNPKGNQSCIVIGQTGAKAPILWPPDVKSWLIGEDSDAGGDWRQEEIRTEDMMVGWHHWLNGHEFEQTPGNSGGHRSLDPAVSFSVCIFTQYKYIYMNIFISLLFSLSVVSDSLWPYGLQHARLSCPSPSPGVCSNSWIESVMPSKHLIVCRLLPLLPSICPASVSSSESSISSGQSIGASASVLPMNIQGWFPLGSTGLILLLSKELKRAFSSNTVRKHQFFSAQLSL